MENELVTFHSEGLDLSKEVKLTKEQYDKQIPFMCRNEMERDGVVYEFKELKWYEKPDGSFFCLDYWAKKEQQSSL